MSNEAFQQALHSYLRGCREWRGERCERTVHAIAVMTLRNCWREGEVDVTENVAPRFLTAWRACSCWPAWDAQLVRKDGKTQVRVWERSAIERLGDLS